MVGYYHLAQTGILKTASSLTDIVNSAQPCPGDANLDGVINLKDFMDQVKWIGITNGSSTWWDMNQDGYTNDLDISLLKTAISPCKLPR